MADKSLDNCAARNELRIATRLAARAKQRHLNVEDSEKSKKSSTLQPSAPIASDRKQRLAQSGDAAAHSTASSEARQDKAFNPTIDEIMKIRRKSMSGLRAESAGLGKQLGETRANLRKAIETKRSAQGWLQELKDNTPVFTMSGGMSFPTAEFIDALRTIGKWLKTLTREAPTSRKRVPRVSAGRKPVGIALDVISGSIGILGDNKSLQDSKVHGALIAKQKRIISELGDVVYRLELEDREILAQIEDKEREKKDMASEND